MVVTLPQSLVFFPLSSKLSKSFISFQRFNQLNLLLWFSKCINFNINHLGSLGISDVCILYLFFFPPALLHHHFSFLLYLSGEGMRSIVVILLHLPLLKMNSTLRGEGKGAVIELSTGTCYWCLLKLPLTFLFFLKRGEKAE